MRPAHDVRLHQLEGFFHVCRHAGFASAVRALPHPITEAALHQQVRKLERALDTPLLVKGAGRRMVPTPEGRRLFEFVAPYFQALPSLLDDISGGRSAILTVATEPLYVDRLCGPALQRLGAERPGLTLRLLERDGVDITKALAAGDVDVGVSSELAPLPAGIGFEPLGRLALLLLVPPRHPWGRKRRITPKLLGEEALILYESGTAGRTYSDAALAALGLHPEAAAEASSAVGMRAMVAAGIAPAVIPALRAGAARRRTNAGDGVVEHVVTDLLEGVLELPRYGLLEREHTTNENVRAFADAVSRRKT